MLASVAVAIAVATAIGSSGDRGAADQRPSLPDETLVPERIRRSGEAVVGYPHIGAPGQGSVDEHIAYLEDVVFAHPEEIVAREQLALLYEGKFEATRERQWAEKNRHSTSPRHSGQAERGPLAAHRPAAPHARSVGRCNENRSGVRPSRRGLPSLTS